MARPSSAAIGGYYAAPPEVLPSIAALIRVHTGEETKHGEATEHALLDPCAGEGAAMLALARAWFGHPDFTTLKVHANLMVYACELEKTRADACEQALWREMKQHDFSLLKGDAFAATWAPQYHRGLGVTLCWLNPPYDHDRELGRLEERWLRRFTPSIAIGGVLLFLVPFYALAASAETIGQHFEDLSCFRLPEPHFAVFKQVILVARRRVPLLTPDPAAVARVRAWAASAEASPVLPEAGPAVLDVHGLPDGEAGWGRWELAPLDFHGVLTQLVPWGVTDRGGRTAEIPGIIPTERFDALQAPTFPLATPPRPAHIAAGIASGALSGARLEPTDPGSGRPALIVKGRFARRFRTVDTKTNKDGEITAEVQVQYPELQITALDLSTSTYHRLRSDVEITGARTTAEMTVGDLLDLYGRDLLGALRERCPTLYDPARPEDQTPLPHLARELYEAQANATRAVCKLLDKPDQAAIILGEIGVGKSTVALAAAATRGARRVLIMCPPHLLKSWTDQAHAVVSWARTVILEDVAQVDAVASFDGPEMVIAILSRETAKLGHAWEGISTSCPRCGAAHPASADELARKRTRCEHREIVASGRTARLAERLALLLAPASSAPRVQELVRGRIAKRLALKRAAADCTVRAAAWPEVVAKLAPIAREMARALCRVDRAPSDKGIEALGLMLLAIRDDALTIELARELYEASLTDPVGYGNGATLRRHALDLTLLLPLDGAAQRDLIDELRAHKLDTLHYYDPMGTWREDITQLTLGKPVHWIGRQTITIQGGVHHVGKIVAGSVEAAVASLEALAVIGRWSESEPCGEPLYQAVPRPRRVPLAHYIRQRAPRLFDMAILDEAHELSNQDSAQSLAAQQICALKIPTVLLTGSIMNGYASSLFILLWYCSAAFRAEFDREDLPEFVRRYGYLKQVVEMVDGRTREKVAFGAVTDRVERVERTQGQAPGVLPALLLRHLLPIAVTLQMEDLNVDMPPAREMVELVESEPELRSRYERLKSRLLQQIRADRFSDRSGKLFGALAELPSYLDRATEDVGNCADGAYELRYPDEVEKIGKVVDVTPGKLLLREDGFARASRLPKEQWLIDTVTRELAEERRVMVLCWHVQLLPRIASVLEQATGEKAPILWAQKVPPAKREAWIDREVIAKGRRILVCNPVAIQTGLNNLVHFASEVWVENPACNPQIRRQAVGRVRRLGQTLETRIYTPIYKGTLQEVLHKLLLHKIGVSEAADGLDATAALQAAGVGGADELAGRDLGRLLYQMLTEEGAGTKVRQARGQLSIGL